MERQVFYRFELKYVFFTLNMLKIVVCLHRNVLFDCPSVRSKRYAR